MNVDLAAPSRRLKLIVLDRDGVINFDNEEYVKSPEEWVPLPGSLEAIAQLNSGGYHVVIATNQSGIGRGLFDAQILIAIHAKMHQMLGRVGGRIDAVFFCPHTERSACDCRKPKPGMLREIAQRFRIELDDVPCIGDSLRDLQAASAVNALPILVRTGKGEETLKNGTLPPRTQVFDSLADFANALLAELPIKQKT
ncbi:MAG: D-glycero-beta-D-manno-heptose 1,7-bisphosphate 7-phosphatase [Burkholderiales bacterium]|nr:D-glycero-beta-D-manno-heptose 1,7-bisphosphate 7-phosphatase [Burkholderiales bacterium]